MKAIVASITPFDSKLGLDIGALWRHCDRLFESGADEILLQGTTGEASSLSMDERLEMIHSIPNNTADPSRLIMGVGLSALDDTLELANAALGVGVRKLLILPPYFYKGVSDDGLYEYFARLISALEKKDFGILLYHIPQISGIPFSHDLIARLTSSFGSAIIGIKDSTGNWDHTKSLIESFPKLNIFAGNEKLALRSLNAGGAGCISAGANVSISLLRELIDAEDERKDGLQGRLTAIRTALEKTTPIVAIKGVIDHVEDAVRPPLMQADDPTIETIKSASLASL